MNATDKQNPALLLKGLSATDWLRFGVAEVAYLRPALLNGVRVVEIHAADGQQIGQAPTIASAAAAVMEHELAPVLVH